MGDYMNPAKRLEKELAGNELDALNKTCALCFRHLQNDCEGCPVSELFDTYSNTYDE